MGTFKGQLGYPKEDVKALYVHVPFCPKVCHYCDFAVLKAGEKHHESWWECLQIELETKLSSSSSPNYTLKHSWDTIYFGGGTPSLLSADLWKRILDYFHHNFDLGDLREFTIEVNPETLTKDRLDVWKSMGINRLSMGIQTFQDDILKTLGRSCDSQVNRNALQILSESGINYSADLMFGLPGQNLQMFLDDMKEVLSYNPNHVSFYGLTVEEGTLFDQWLKQGKIQIDDEIQSEMYLQGIELLAQNGLHRYELSNFARLGFEAIHNSKYWNDYSYVGVGPGAHSYNAQQRVWNHKHLSKWSQSIQTLGCSVTGKELYFEKEEIGQSERLNEYLWLSLRQAKGISREKLKKDFDFEIPESTLEDWGEHLDISKDRISLKDEGWLLIDEIIISMI